MPVNNTNKSRSHCIAACATSMNGAMSHQEKKVNNMSNDREQPYERPVEDEKFTAARKHLTELLGTAMHEESACRQLNNDALSALRRAERRTKTAAENLALLAQGKLPL